MSQTIISRERLSRNLHLPRFFDLSFTQRRNNEVKMNTNSSKVVTEPQLRFSATGMQVVHATNGRIRIKATEDSFSSNCKTIIQYLGQFPGVKEVATNKQTSSLVVSFDEKQLSLSEMLGILQQLNIQTSPDAAVSDPFAAWKSVDFWKEQTISFIPLMTGLAVTGRLGISGLASIPVYMITADATRRVIDYLKPLIASEFNGESGDGGDKSANKETKAPIVKQDREITTWSAKVTYSVIHKIPGRIRFHLPILTSDRAYGRRLEKLLKTDPVVENVRINSDAASIAITYKPNAEIAVSHWVSLMELALETTPPKVPVSEVLQTTPPTSEPVVAQQLTEPDNIKTAEVQTIYISSWWADMKSSALSYSLDFIANLPL
ncbi:HMA2 domain-containing protein [Anabaena sp. CCY 9402-a]|uniref:HMA2 domain-containing protein n=1 Tax=Anabaena sp. CCY 9402-a TaxID=3103867 RepID=UPI0039C6035C